MIEQAYSMLVLPSVPLRALRVCARVCFLAAAAVAALAFGGISLPWLSPPLLFHSSSYRLPHALPVCLNLALVGWSCLWIARFLVHRRCGRSFSLVVAMLRFAAISELCCFSCLLHRGQLDVCM